MKKKKKKKISKYDSPALSMLAKKEALYRLLSRDPVEDLIKAIELAICTYYKAKDTDIKRRSI